MLLKQRADNKYKSSTIYLYFNNFYEQVYKGYMISWKISYVFRH